MAARDSLDNYGATDELGAPKSGNLHRGPRGLHSQLLYELRALNSSNSKEQTRGGGPWPLNKYSCGEAHR